MDEIRVKCQECDSMILPRTAEANNGLCGQCVGISERQRTERRAHIESLQSGQAYEPSPNELASTVSFAALEPKLGQGAMFQLDEINQLGGWEWNLFSFDGYRLCLAGGIDLTYSHVVEVWISGVEYLSCPTVFDDATFRQATDAERATLARIVDLASSNVVVAIEAETTASIEPITFFIVGDALDVVRGTVYHYQRPDLKPGERLASWVVKEDR